MEENFRHGYYFGQELDWDAERIPVVLLVELPYWLMIPDSSLTININGYVFNIEISDHFHELYGSEVFDSRITCAYIGPLEKVDKDICQETIKMNTPILWRKCKTVVKIHSLCNGDVFKTKGEKHESVAELYLKTFCEAHIEVLNKLIQNYRLATYDYFPFEVYPWTVPIWWITTGTTNSFKLCLLDYKKWDYKPVLRGNNQEKHVYNLISPNDLQQSFLKNEPSPGEYDLLDALNFMERGDYNGAVRRITTAIEVLVESLLIERLKEIYEEQEVHKIFKKVKNNFPGKLNKYIELSGRTLDEWIEPELKKIRDLRHEIVHAAVRISFNNRGLAQEKVDKGRWIYNWFENKEEKKVVREQRIGMRSLGRHLPSAFNYEITSQGVIIENF